MSSKSKQPNVSVFLGKRSDSESFLSTQNEAYNVFMEKLKTVEAYREDNTVKIRKIRPVDLSQEGNWKVKHLNENGTQDYYQLNEQA